MIFMRALGYLVFKERPGIYDAGLGPVMGLAGEGGPVPLLDLLDRDGFNIQDRAGDDIETRA